MESADPNVLASVEFEVYGQVQGCYFTKYCKELAEQLGIAGWVKNSKKGTIVGKIQGNKSVLDHIDDLISTMEAFAQQWDSPHLSVLFPVASKAIASKPGVRLDHDPGIEIDWLKTTGSPGCKIEKCELTNWDYLSRLDYSDFSIRF